MTKNNDKNKPNDKDINRIEQPESEMPDCEAPKTEKGGQPEPTPDKQAQMQLQSIQGMINELMEIPTVLPIEAFKILTQIIEQSTGLKHEANALTDKNGRVRESVISIEPL